jgi:hypothetical protein
MLQAAQSKLEVFLRTRGRMGYPSNQDTRERKQKKYEKQGGGDMSVSNVDGREKESKGTLKEKEKE